MAVLFGWTTEVRWIILLIDGKWTGFGHFEASASTWTRNWVSCGSQRMQRRSQCGCFQDETQPSSSRGCPVTCHTSSGMLLPFFKHQKKKIIRREEEVQKWRGEKNVPAPRSMIFLCLPLAFILFFFEKFQSFFLFLFEHPTKLFSLSNSFLDVVSNIRRWRYLPALSTNRMRAASPLILHPLKITKNR